MADPTQLDPTRPYPSHKKLTQNPSRTLLIEISLIFYYVFYKRFEIL